MIRRLFAAAAAIGVLPSAAAQEAGFTPSSYVQVGIGGSAVTEEGAVATGIDFEGKAFRDDGVLDYDAGLAVGALYGWQALPALALEAELSARVNDFEDNLGDPLTVTSFLANAALSPPRARAVIPYVGGGIGFATTNIEDTGLGFAYQAKVGVKVPIRARGAVGAEVAWLGTSGFDSDFRDEFGDPATFDIDYAGLSVMATYTFDLGR